MRAYSGEYSQKHKERVSIPSGKWRKLYQCKVLKGDHEFKLVKPNYSFLSYKQEYKDLTVLQYYAEQEKKKEDRTGFFSKVLYHYECVGCKKHEYGYKDDIVPNRRIKKLLPITK